ncbi:MAG: tRNA 2-thiouridine(34) synthase MnmA [Phycisphaerales bacterium]
MPSGPENPRRPGAKVLLAMSGGVDSSLAAALLKEQGYDVVGVFMRLGSPGDTLDTPLPDACDTTKIKLGKQGCCSVGDAADARLVAAHLGIPFYVCNFKNDFDRIIDYFVDEYASGRTPNPCVRCNDWLKFGKLHDYAQQLGADLVASGHYARVLPPSPFRGEGRGEGSPFSSSYSLLRAIDHTKDQSYVLFGVPRDHLSRMLLPIGHLRKSETRAMAEARHLPVFDKPDSQEICFVPDNDYAGLVERRRPDLATRGAILDTDGHEIGEHDGAHHFTIGQRRGLNLPLGRPVYVVAKDATNNTITVGDRDDLLADGCLAAEANWLVDSRDFVDWTPCHAQIRYNASAVPARVRVIPDLDAPTPSGRTAAIEVRFDEPQPAVAPGQAVVLYSHHDPDLVLGGAWIARATPMSRNTPTSAALNA